MELVLFPPGVGSMGKEGRTRASGAEAAYFHTKEARAASERVRGNLWFSRLLTDAGFPSPSPLSQRPSPPLPCRRPQPSTLWSGWRPGCSMSDTLFPDPSISVSAAAAMVAEQRVTDAGKDRSRHRRATVAATFGAVFRPWPARGQDP